jgi:hypothetical protein
MEDAVAAGREGMTRAADNAGIVWRDEARQWLYDFLQHNRIYLPDAAWAHGCPEPPNDRRAFGSVIAWAVRQSYMVKDGSHPRLSGHGTEGPKYRSTIYEGSLG